MSKIEKYGRYVRKVGYLDIRQKIKFATKVKDRVTGELKVVPGVVEILLYHGKKLVESGFKSHTDAEKRAKEIQKL